MELFEKMTVPAIADAIGIALDDWPYKCTWVAVAMRRSGFVQGELVNGHATFINDGGDGRHSWIELSDERVVDPLRWFYEGVEPYIWVGPCGPEYMRQPNVESSLDRLLRTMRQGRL